jgi:hypothetical protein
LSVLAAPEREDADVQQRQRNVGLESQLTADALGNAQVTEGVVELSQVDQDVAEVLLDVGHRRALVEPAQNGERVAVRPDGVV